MSSRRGGHLHRAVESGPGTAELASQALRLGTRNAGFLFHAGMIELRLGHEGAARALLRQAFDTNPFFSVRWSPVLRDTLSRLGDA